MCITVASMAEWIRAALRHTVSRRLYNMFRAISTLWLYASETRDNRFVWVTDVSSCVCVCVCLCLLTQLLMLFSSPQYVLMKHINNREDETPTYKNTLLLPCFLFWLSVCQSFSQTHTITQTHAHTLCSQRCVRQVI